MVTLADEAFMALYGHMKRNARRLTRLGFALLPLMMLHGQARAKPPECRIILWDAKKPRSSAPRCSPTAQPSVTQTINPPADIFRARRISSKAILFSLSRLTEQERSHISYGKPERERMRR